jgi:hypothetical protein
MARAPPCICQLLRESKLGFHMQVSEACACTSGERCHQGMMLLCRGLRDQLHGHQLYDDFLSSRQKPCVPTKGQTIPRELRVSAEFLRSLNQRPTLHISKTAMMCTPKLSRTSANSSTARKARVKAKCPAPLATRRGGKVTARPLLLCLLPTAG